MALRWIFDPFLLGTLLLATLLYGLAVGPLRERIAPGTRFPRGRAALFYSAIGLTFLAEASPLHDLAERHLFSAHMVQHLALSYLVAPLFLWGVPAWLWRSLLVGHLFTPLVRLLTHPLIAFALFNVFFSLWHLPVIYEGALHNSTLHHFEHVVFLGISLLLWWPLMSPLPELPRLPYAGQILYLMGMPIAQLPVFAAVTFATGPLYATYAASTLFDPHTDQALGGVLMKVGGLIAFGVPFIVIFWRWYESENPRSRRPVRAR